MKNTTIEKVLDKIEQETEFSFLVMDKSVNLHKKVDNIQADHESIDPVLDRLFKETEIAYRIIDRQIVLLPAATAATLQDNLQQDKRTITGTVRDAAGEPVMGAIIVEKGTNNSAVSDADGKFTIKAASGASATLRFSMLGFEPQEIVVGSRNIIDITLKENNLSLDEVVVLGYGTQARKADLSAAIGTISNIEAVKQRPVTSVGGMLQGQIPGVTVRNESGDPTQDQSIVIRGRGSRGTGDRAEKALVVVDGVPGANYNVDEVENVVVLKDAASAAIYGAYSGSAGVILVTTKKAKSGVTTVSYDGTFGVNHPVNLPQSLTAEEQMRVRTASHQAAGIALPDGWDPAKNPYIATTRTDWIDLIFRDALFQRHTIALSGGTETMSNRLSLNYTSNEGTQLNTFKKTFQLRYNASFQPVKWVKISEDAWFTTSRVRGTNNSDGYDGTLMRAMTFPRSAEAYYSDGTIGGTAPKDPAYIAQYGNFANIHGDIQNPLRGLISEDQRKIPINVNSSTFLEISGIVPGLRFTSRFTYRLTSDDDKVFTPRVPEVGKPNLNNSLNYYSARSTYWESENTLNYDRSFGKHTVGAMISTTLNGYEGWGHNIGARGFENEDLALQYLSFAGDYTIPSDFHEIDRNLAYVGRASYSYDNRYFVTASMRRDYAGRLPKGKKSGDFPSITAAWKLSEEAFMPQSDFLNLLKLRGSWGRIGNINSVGRTYGFPALSIYGYGTGNAGMIGEPNLVTGTGVQPGRAYNPFLTWETSEQTDFGIDLELLSHRLSFSADWFNKKTFNLIKDQDYGWPSYIGAGAKTINEGKISNTGFEFTAGWNDKIGDVSYFVNANLATLKNKITDIGAIDPATGKKPEWGWGDSYRNSLQPFRSREGDPLYSYWLIKTGGLFQTDAEAAAYVDKDGKRIQPNAKAGDLKFIDKNGDGKINDEDREYLGAYFPEVTYALTAGMKWKNLSFNFMLQGVGGVKIFHEFKLLMLNDGMMSYNRWNRILDAFPNSNDIPRLNAADVNGNFSTNSDWYLENGSYLRVKNITLGYDLTPILRKAHYFDQRRSALSLTLGADNLLTFTKYSGIDPEVGGNGMDGGAYPLSATYTLGLKLTF